MLKPWNDPRLTRTQRVLELYLWAQMTFLGWLGDKFRNMRMGNP